MNRTLYKILYYTDLGLSLLFLILFVVLMSIQGDFTSASIAMLILFILFLVLFPVLIAVNAKLKYKNKKDD